MGHFNVLKGAYPSLKQLDKTLPLGTGGTAIVRGSCMVISANAFVPAADGNAGGTQQAPANGDIVYFALQNAGDPDVQMANGITGLPCVMPMEVETDQFYAAQNPAIGLGDFLMCKTGGIVCTHAAYKTAIGVCTKAAYTRWSNNAVAVAGVKTGNKISVISFWTMYAPNLVVA